MIRGRVPHSWSSWTRSSRSPQPGERDMLSANPASVCVPLSATRLSPIRRHFRRPTPKELFPLSFREIESATRIKAGQSGGDGSPLDENSNAVGAEREFTRARARLSSWSGIDRISHSRRTRSTTYGD